MLITHCISFHDKKSVADQIKPCNNKEASLMENCEILLDLIVLRVRVDNDFQLLTYQT